MQDTTLVFTLFDADGILGREPVRLSLVAVPDQPPQVAVRLSGIGSAITPQARLPVSGHITDDYGIARLWFEYAIDRLPPAMADVLVLPKHPAEWTLTDKALDAGPLNVKASQKLLLALKAADLCDLPPARTPNVGASERWLLDVVAPEQLRAMLEAREVMLRWRFMGIVDEVTQTRDLLLRTRFGQTVGKGKADKKESPPAGKKVGYDEGSRRGLSQSSSDEGTRRGLSQFRAPCVAWSDENGTVPLGTSQAPPSPLLANRGWSEDVDPSPFVAPATAGQRRPATKPSERPEGAEPGEEAEPQEELSPQQQLDMQRSLAQQALETSRKNAQETLGVAEGFDDIRQQFMNNRIDSEALRKRLGAGIAEPLRKIADQMFPELERRLDALDLALADPQRGLECRGLAQAAQKQADNLLLAMQTVLNHMIEMLDYNQLVDSLRKIIEQQDQVYEQTKKRQDRRFRESLGR